MRVAHVSATFPPYLAGTGNVCYHLALELTRRGHRVTVFTAEQSGSGYCYPGDFEVRRLPVLFRLGNAPCLPSLFGMECFDVVHLHYPFFFGSEFVLLRSLVQHGPYVVTYHHDALFPGALGLAARLHHLAIGQLVLRRARVVLTSSWDYAWSSRLRYLLRTRAVPVDELANGVDPTRFRPNLDARALRTRYGLARDARVVLFVGALDRPHFFKGVPILLKAFARLADPRARLLVVGEGDLRTAYQRQAAALGLATRVIFCGRVSEEKLPEHYAAADLLVLPSTTGGEAFGVVLLEAMASGKPVVASDLPGVRSVVTDGADGLLARPGDADDLATKLQALLDNPGQRQTMGERGRAKVEGRYSWPHLGRQLAEIYEQVAPAHKLSTRMFGGVP